MKAVLVLLLAGAFATSTSHQSWTLAHARRVLGSKTYSMTDTSQADRPQYELRFSSRSATSLRRGFVFSGLAYDAFTDRDVRVRFKFTRPGLITGFSGPVADTSQPSFPIHAAFYYAWYPEAWFRDPVFPYTRIRPSLEYYSAADAHIVHSHTEALRYAHLDAGIYSWWGPNGYPPTDGRFWRYLAAARDHIHGFAVLHAQAGREQWMHFTFRFRVLIDEAADAPRLRVRRISPRWTQRTGGNILLRIEPPRPPRPPW